MSVCTSESQGIMGKSHGDPQIPAGMCAHASVLCSKRERFGSVLY